MTGRCASTRGTAKGKDSLKMIDKKRILISLLAVVVVFSACAILLSNNGSLAGTVNPDQSITYHYSQSASAYSDVTVDYYGIPSTEYNPQVWAGTVENINEDSEGSDVNWTEGPDGQKVTLDDNLNLSVDATGIFAITCEKDDGVWKLYLVANGEKSDWSVRLIPNEDRQITITRELFRIAVDGSSSFTSINKAEYRFTLGTGTDQQYQEEVRFKITVQSNDGVVKARITNLQATDQLVNISDGSNYSLDVAFTTNNSTSLTDLNVTPKKVFGGWLDHFGNLVYPGDVVSRDVQDLWVNWINPDVTFSTSKKDNGASTGEGDSRHYEISYKIDANGYKVINALSEATSATVYHYDESQSKYVSGTSGNMFASIFYLKSDVGSANLPSGTYRSLDIEHPITISINGSIVCQGDVVIDNVILKQNGQVHRLAGDANYSINANYHRLIMGTGIESKANNQTLYLFAPYVIGGNANPSRIGDTSKPIVFNETAKINSGIDDGSVIKGDWFKWGAGSIVHDYVVDSDDYRSGDKEFSILVEQYSEHYLKNYVVVLITAQNKVSFINGIDAGETIEGDWFKWGTGDKVVNYVVSYGDFYSVASRNYLVLVKEGVDLEEKNVIEINKCLEVNIATFVIVHSGTYIHLDAGAVNATIGSLNSNPLSTYMVVKKATVMGIVAGTASTSNVNGRTNGFNEYTDTYIQGGTFVYAYNLRTTGDTYEDLASGVDTPSYKNGDDDVYWAIDENSVFQGGPQTGKVRGSSHVFVTGTSSVFDVQGGGRSTKSGVDVTYLEISGNAEVRHIACGSTTDGNELNTDVQTVHNVHISVEGNPHIATLLGAGYDTWYDNALVSMKNSKIDVRISGGTIGYVYGGGMRSNIGQGDGIKITITMTDGVIEMDLFGGGKGGVDKIHHWGANNTKNNTIRPIGSAGRDSKTGSNYINNSNTTGYAKIVGDIVLNLEGGTVQGNVYGGGESAPAINTYMGSSRYPTKDSNYSNYGGAKDIVSSVEGNITINISGTTVNNGVYGAGKGLMTGISSIGNDPSYLVPISISDNLYDRLTQVVSGTTTYGQMLRDGLDQVDNMMPSFATIMIYVDGEYKYIPWMLPYVEKDTTTSIDCRVTYQTSNYYQKYAQLQGVTEVNVTGGTISSVYGGGSMSIVNATDAMYSTNVNISGGSISNNVFAGGYGEPGRDSVYGIAKAIVEGGTVGGSVYGGSEKGAMKYDTAVKITGDAVVTGNVFGGGFGTAYEQALNNISSYAHRTVYISNGKIGGSVYGGSQVGVDGKVIEINDGNITSAVETALNKARSTVVVEKGTISGSVYGGGLMGKTYGNTQVYIGYRLPSLTSFPVPNEYAADSGLQITINSVFAGGNVSTEGDDSTITNPFSESLVQGSGTVLIYGNTSGAIGISGSIMGSGNACLTRGTTDVTITNLYDATPLTAIHRIDNLTIDNSNLKINGRNPLTKVFGQDKIVSVYKIGQFVMRNNSSIAIETPIDDIGGLKSYGANGKLTSETSPQNRFVYMQGSTVYIRSADENNNPVYNKVEGYIMMVSTKGSYGAYAMGYVSDKGGFSVSGDASIRAADTSIANNICCWYIAGTEKKVLTLNLQVNDDSRNTVYTESYVDITKIQADTDLIYSGGSFTRMSNNPNGDPYKFVRPGAESMEDNSEELGLAIAYKKSTEGGHVAVYDPTYRMMSIAGGKVISQQGTFFSKDNKESDISGEARNRSLASVPMLYSSGGNGAGEFRVYFCLTAMPEDGTSYVGYLMLNFQEVKQVSYGAVGGGGSVEDTARMLVANTIEVRIDIYIYGSVASGSQDTFSVDLKTTTDLESKRSGESFTLIPQTYTMAELELKDVESIGPGSGYMPAIYVESSSSYTLPECKYVPPQGKTFKAWSVKIGSADAVEKQPGSTISVTSETVVKPVWERMAQIMFDGNGDDGTKTMSSMPIKCGTEYKLPECAYTKSGSTLAKWSVIIGSEKEVERKPGEIITISGDTFIKAIWGDTKTVTFYSGGGSGTMRTDYIALNERYELPDSDFTYDGRLFLNWSVSVNDGDAVIKYPGETIKAAGNIKVTANWTTSTSYTVTFHKYDGHGIQKTVAVASGAKYLLPVYDGDYPYGERFYKWAVSMNGGDENEYDEDEYLTITSNVEIRPVWSTLETITFSSGEHGSYSLSVDLAFGREYTIPKYLGSDVPGFTFSSWKAADKYYYPGQVITVRSDLSFVAQWESDSSLCNRVFFDPCGGTGFMTMLKLSHGTSTYDLPNCEYEAPVGKVFSGWSVNNVEKQPGQSITVSRDTIVKPVWADQTTTGVAKDHVVKVYEAGKTEPCYVYIVKHNTQYLKYDGTYASVTDDVSIDLPGSTSKLGVIFNSGVSVMGKVVVTAQSNSDGTTGWSNVGGEVVWNLATGRLDDDSNYIGTLLGNIIGNIKFEVRDLKMLDIDGDPFLPIIDVVFDRGGVEAHTNLIVLDKQYYSVIYVDHGIETIRSYEEGTSLNRDNCETPTGNNFNGWYLDSGYETIYDYNLIVNEDTNGLTLYARYTYVVTLDNMNGTTFTLYVAQENKGALISETDLPKPVYTGYDFKGWYKDSALVYEWGYQSDRVTEDITLYAKWVGKDVRVYFWYYDNEDGKLTLFNGIGSGEGSGVKPDANGRYDLKKAYKLNEERGLYPTVRYGETFDVKDPYHTDGSKSILEYAQTALADHFIGSFVKWTVASPNDVYLRMNVYDDTVMGSKVLKYVTDSMVENYDDMWDYYMHNDGGYPRIDWVGDDKPETMEIHLLAETTKVAIKVSMGLYESDEKYSSTITIDDPENFLVYPNGPNPSAPKIIDGVQQYYDEEKTSKIVYGDYEREYHEGIKIGGEVLFYWNDDETVRYYYNSTDKCWTCISEEKVLSTGLDTGEVKHDGEYKKQNTVRAFDYDEYGNFKDMTTQYVKSFAYLQEWDGSRYVENKYIVEWIPGTGKASTVYSCYEDGSGMIVCGDTPLPNMPSTGYYLKHGSDGLMYIVESSPPSQGNIKAFLVQNSYLTDCYEFIFKLNNAVRSGYTLLGWHNDYVSVLNSINPSADTIRTMQITTDADGYVNTAIVLDKDTSGNTIRTPLLVGNYIVDPKDADVDGKILIVNSSTHITQFKIKINEETPITGKTDGASVGLSKDDKSSDYTFLGWKVKDRYIQENEYTVSSYYADANGEIVIKSVNEDASPITSFTVKLLKADGTVLDTISDKTDGQSISLTGTYLAPVGYEWRVRSESIVTNSYTVSATQANAEGVIVLKLFTKGAASATTFKIKVDGEYLNGAYSAGKIVSLGTPGDGKKWRIGNDDVVGYTVSALDADAEGTIQIREEWSQDKKYTIRFENTKGDDPADLPNVGLGESIVLEQMTSSGLEFLGWKSISGTLESSVYVVSDDDAVVSDDGGDPENIITLTTFWDETRTKYNVKFITERGTLSVLSYDDQNPGALLTLPEVEDAGNYELVSWKYLTSPGTIHRGSGYFYVSPTDADSENYIVLKAVWAKKYSVVIKTGNVPSAPIMKTEGEIVTLDYSTYHNWKVSDDVMEKGKTLYPSLGDPLTINYRANWERIDYFVHVTQPSNGHIDMYLEDPENAGVSNYVTDDFVNNNNFHFGDKIKLSYTSSSSKVAFVKWEITGQYLISDPNDPEAILIIQGGCSIAAVESSSTIIDIMIAFDDGNLNAGDRNYTRVFMHDKVTDDYYEATYVPGLAGMEHYTVKIPYGNNYEVCLRFGWTLPGPDGTCTKLRSFEDGYDEYVLTGDVKVAIGEDLTLIYDVISARFLESIDSDVVDYRDTEYGELTNGTMQTGVSIGTEFSGSWNVWGQGTTKTPYNVVSDDALYEGLGPKFIGLVDSSTVLTDYTVIRIDGSGRVTYGTGITSGSIAGSWNVWGQGSTVSPYNFNSSDALYKGSGPKFIVLVDSGYTSSLTDLTVITITKSVKYDFLFDKYGKINESSRTYHLDTNYEFIGETDPITGHYIRVVDNKGTPVHSDDVVVAKVSKYQGILRSELAVIAAHNLNINKPNGGTPPVVLEFGPNQTYSTYEGFPWTVSGQRVFALESDINLSIDADSNMNTQKTFYLNWVRTDSPADIILQLDRTTAPTYYATADVVVERDQPDDHEGFVVIVKSDVAISGDPTVIEVTSTSAATVVTNPAGTISGSWMLWGKGVAGDYVIKPDDAYNGFIVLVDSTVSPSLTNITLLEVTSTDSATVETNKASGDRVTANTWKLWNKGDAIKYAINYALVQEGIKYNLLRSSGINVKYPLDQMVGYGISCVSSGIGGGESVEITSENEIHFVLTSNHDNAVKVLIKYNKSEAWFALNDMTYGYDTSGYPYNHISYNIGYTGYAGWGYTIELPTKFTYTSAEGSKEVKILHWRVVKPVGEGNYIESSDGKFIYNVLKSDAINTSDFTYYVYGGDSEYRYVYSDSGYTDLVYKVNKSNVVCDTEGNELAIKLYKSWTCIEEDAYKYADGNCTVYRDNRLLFVPLITYETVTISFVTHYQSFSDGSQRETFTVTAGGQMKDYDKSVDRAYLIVDFVNTYRGDTSMEYVFGGFYYGDTLFDPTGTQLVDKDMTFVAKWDPNPAMRKVFTYTQEGTNADISALRDASSEPFDEYAPNRLMKDTEVSIYIQPKSGYTIDVEGTRGELGYMLTEDRYYTNVTAPIKPVFGGKEFASWRLWGTGTPVASGSTVTESSSSVVKGLLVYTADWGEDPTKKFVVVFVKEDGSTEMMRKDSNETISLTGSLSGSWLLWNETAKETSYTVSQIDAQNGFIVFIKEGKVLGDLTAVFATEYGSISFAVEDLEMYYKDNSGNLYHKINRGTVYRLESGVWKEYTVTDLTGKDSKMIRQFSGESKVYKVTRDGRYFVGTPGEFTVSDSDNPKYVKKLTGSSKTYYLDSNAVVYLNNAPVNVSFFNDFKLITRAVELSDYTGTVYNAEFEETLSFVEFYSMTPTFKVLSSDKSALKDMDGNAVTLKLYNDSGRNYDVTNYYDDGSPYLYTKDPAKTYYVNIKESVKTLYLLEQYGSRYEPIETSFNYYDGGPYTGNQFKDIFDNIWVQDPVTGEFKIVSVTVYEFNPDRVSETPIVIKFNNDEEIISGAYPAQYYFKDQYGNHVVGNHLVNNKIKTLYLDKGNEEVEMLSVKYIERSDYVKELSDESGAVKYYIKKNGALMDLDKNVLSYKLYHDEDCTDEYKSDYSITMINPRYNTYTEVKINNISYYEDVFGNRYDDWLGTPTKLSGTRGYVWTFFLKESIDLTIKTKKVSYNINFIINGLKVNPSDLNAVSTVATNTYTEGTTPAHNKEFNGQDIPQYTIVAFDGPEGNRDIVWYTDPQYTTEYDVHNGRAILSPSKFQVDVTMADALVKDGNTFTTWKLWGTGSSLNPGTRQVLNDESTDHEWKSFGTDKNNFFYMFVADWATPDSGTYTVVFASTQGSFDTGNLVRDESGVIIDIPTLSGSTGLLGWKLWNIDNPDTNLSKDATKYTIKEADAKDNFILFVADWEDEDLTKASNIVYASEYGKVPAMDSVRKYQFMADQNISLYAHMGTYVLYLHNFYDDADKTIKYELTVNEDNQLVLPSDHYDLENYVFIGWAVEKVDESDGNKVKRFYTYVPEESIWAASVKDSIDLFPYYVSDGSEVKFYDGQQGNLKISLDEILAEKQHVPETTVLSVKYNSDDDPETATVDPPASASGIHVGDYHVYYWASIKTPLGISEDESYGNTATSYEFKDRAMLRILPVDAFVVAPSIYERYDGTEKSVTPGEIEEVGLMEDDYTVTLSTTDGYGTSRTEQGVTLTHVNINWKGFITLVNTAYSVSDYTVVWISSDNVVSTNTGLSMGGSVTKPGAWKLWGAGDDLPVDNSGNTKYTIKPEDVGTNGFIILTKSDYGFRGLTLITLTNGSTGTSTAGVSEGTVPVEGTYNLWGLGSVTDYQIRADDAQGYMYDPSPSDKNKKNYEVDYALRYIDGSIVIYPEDSSKNEHAGHI